MEGAAGLLHAPNDLAPLNCAFAQHNKTRSIGSARHVVTGLSKTYGGTVYGDWSGSRTRNGAGEWSSLPRVWGRSQQPEGGRQEKA